MTRSFEITIPEETTMKYRNDSKCYRYRTALGRGIMIVISVNIRSDIVHFVDGPQVSEDVAFVIESPVAHFASERPFSCVNSHVFF